MGFDPYFIFKILDYYHYLLTDPRIFRILELKVYFSPDKFYGLSKFGKYDKEKNRAPFGREKLINLWNLFT